MIRLHKVVYLDTLILLNAIVTYILLLSVRAFSSVRTSAFRLIAGAFTGGAASLLMLAPRLPWAATLAVRLAVCAAITLAAFYTGSKKQFGRCLALLLLMTFGCGGVMLFLSQVLGEFVRYRNGFAYLGVSFPGVVLAVTGAYGLLIAGRRLFGRGKERFYYEIELTYGDRTAKGRALFDSGHFVTDCYTGRPVVIVGERFVRRLLDEEAMAELRALGKLTAYEPAGRLCARCIPVQTVSGPRLLPAFTCGAVTVRNEQSYCRVGAVSLAVAQELPDAFGCDALINQKLFEEQG